ncbi:MAG: HAD-IC family P-type ATPase [Chloroflexi bacterium]|nr:HAD-IC family P-type ATPase [Chloroflexota bacterium]MYD37691.1 HAD-IC family P-type ATPase [Chloroflexota bacterium]
MPPMQRTRQQEPAIPSLSSAEIQQRIQRGESNDYKTRVGRSYWDIFRDNVLNLFNLVLGSMLVAVVVMGDYATAIFAGFSVVTNTFFGMLQEFNAKRQLDQLAALAEQSVRCRRDDDWVDVPMREVVKDEIIYIQPGDRLVVDGIVLRADSLELDESQLTGESDAIAKAPDAPAFSGSFCTAGTGIMRATQVGADSQINRLSAIAKQYKLVKTPTQIKIDIAVEVAVLLMMVFIPMIFVTGYLFQSLLLDTVRDAVVFTTSLVPQGLVLVAILSLTIGAVKISLQQTLIQRVNAVESLANATVLCFDKTGTLTQNKLAVDKIMPIGAADEAEILRDLHITLENMAHQNNTAQAIAQHIADSQIEVAVPEKLSEIPFNSARKWSAIRLRDRTLLLGAPEGLLPADHPHAYTAEQLAQDGLRVLAFAQTAAEPDFTKGSVVWDLQPLALIVMSDQIRSDIQDTLAAFRAEGLTLKVISGDNLETVRAIAGAAGMEIGTRAYSGQELGVMGDGEFASAVAEAHVFARINPDTKQRIVTALRADGEYVAMVGDGVNDVPALKAADLAIVMNDGTQISKDVADIVLLNNAMSTLPRAFGEGKATTQTIFGTMKLFLVRNFYMVALFVFIAFMALPFPITPVQISWATFGTVNLPATLIAFGWLRPQPIRRFRRDVMDYIFTMGFVAAVMMVALYLLAWLGSEGDLQLTRSAITIMVALFGMLTTWQVQGIDLYQPRSFRQQWRIVLLSIALTVATILAMYVFPDLFEFSPLQWDGGVGSMVIVAIPALFVLTMALVGHGLRYRYLLERFWALLAADRE